MPAHNVVRIAGLMPGGEVWSVNPRYLSPGAGPVLDYDELLEWAEAIGTLTQALVAGAPLRQLLSTAASITSVRVEYITASGLMGQAAEWVPALPVAGGGSPTKPFQSAIVGSLLTGRPGRSFRGRLYWPALNISLNTTTLRIESGVAQGYANALADYLTDIGNAAPNGDPAALVVVSQTRDVATPVTSISVGNVLDVQRRRRDALEELRVSQTYPYTAP